MVSPRFPRASQPSERDGPSPTGRPVSPGPSQPFPISHDPVRVPVTTDSRYIRKRPASQKRLGARRNRASGDPQEVGPGVFRAGSARVPDARVRGADWDRHLPDGKRSGRTRRTGWTPRMTDLVVGDVVGVASGIGRFRLVTVRLGSGRWLLGRLLNGFLRAGQASGGASGRNDGEGSGDKESGKEAGSSFHRRG